MTFHSYAGLNSYMRVRNDRVRVRLSDILKEAPANVHRALARILAAKVLHQPINRDAEALYRTYAGSSRVRRKVEWAQRARGRQIRDKPAGRFRDLESTFDRLNKRFFAGRLPRPSLGWSRARSRTVLGHTDLAGGRLIISRLLDSEAIPLHVFEYIVYHEMLHLKHGTRMWNGKRMYHTEAFRSDERKFPAYQRSEAWLRKISTDTLNPSKKYF